MARFVIDASITLAWFIHDLYTPAQYNLALKIRHIAAEDGALTAGLWRVEVAQGLLNAENAGKITAQDAAMFIDSLGMLPVKWLSVPAPTQQLIDKARAYHITTGQVLYLALAARENLPLITLDHALSQAAEVEGLPTDVSR